MTPVNSIEAFPPVTTSRNGHTEGVVPAGDTQPQPQPQPQPEPQPHFPARRTLTVKPNGERSARPAAASAGARLSRTPAGTPSIARTTQRPTPLQQLTAGKSELAITHAGATYLLRVTRANKLILTKQIDASQS
jgi:hemin uptake protein HemP